jgi:pimeloyl-ACP methyl ester carboxylesterase
MIRNGPFAQPLFEHRAEFGGYGTRILELEGDGPPLLLFHGYADSADTWRLVLAELGRRGQRAVAVDLPGFGHADPLRPGPVLPQLDEFAAAAARYAAGRPRQKVIVVGNSLGGCVSLRLAEREGPRLAGVLAAAPAGLEMSRLLFLVERDPILRTLLALPAPVPSAVLRAAVARLYVQLAFASARNADSGVVAAFTSHHRERATVARYLDIAHRMLPELRNALALERIRLPLLLVWGDRDRLLLHRGAQRILDAVPGSRLELLPRIGHCPQVEASDRFTDLLLDFVQELEPPVAAAAVRNPADAGRRTS